MTRGIKLNNPMNIRISNAHWQGKVTPSRDSDFETFDTPEHGIRAGTKILLTYYRDYNLNTVDEIINRWAPSSENDTASYINHVSVIMGTSPHEPLGLTNNDILAKLVEAVIQHEQGQNPYTMAQVDKGVEMALA